MKRRRTTLWLITLALLGSLLSPALALRCVAPETPSRACPMSGKSKMPCCCAEKSSASLDAPCACQMTPGTSRDAGNRAIFLAPDLAIRLASRVSFTVAPLTTAFTTAPLAALSQTPQTLPRAPDSGRAPPVS